MQSLYRALEVIFIKKRCEDLIDRYLSPNVSGKCYEQTDEDNFERLLAFGLPNPSYEEANIVYRQLKEKWMPANSVRADLRYQKGDTIYNAWLNYVASMLRLQNNQPVCRYRYLSEWHKAGMTFGEDIAITAYLASLDLRKGKIRDSFDWPTCLPHDSNDLQVMMKKKMVDLHAHLYATTENFDLNWICLMNHVKSRAKILRQFDAKHLAPTLEMAYHGNQRRLEIKVLIASAIRLFLISQHHDDHIMPYDRLLEIMHVRSEVEYYLLTTALQNKIDLMANLYGRNQQGPYDHHAFRPDYAIERRVNETAVTPLVGERKLLYDTFKHVYQDCDQNREGELFYLYLLIKNEVRREMTHQGQMKGFGNFAKFNTRKYALIDTPYYEQLAERMAAAPFFENHSQKRYLELRVKPETGREQNVRYIQSLERHIKGWRYKNDTEKDWKFDFVFHFIKREDESIVYNGVYDDLLSSIQCRHDQLRKQLKKQACEIGGMKFGPRVGRTGKFPYKSLLVGIDAASSELTCRPEVFAQTFRYLKNQSLQDYDGQEYDLGRTYHVGEVFYDVVDGLRAIDEVMKFLEFSNGDRLGHATVLGIDVKRYYERHNYGISCTKQDLLDNIVWLYVRVQKWIDGKTAFCGYLHEEYSKLFREVYDWEGEIPSIYDYYQSWLLRGDSPYNYRQTREDELLQSVDPWDWYSCSMMCDVAEARENKQAKLLYRLYHFNKQVKEKGHEVTLYKIHERYREQWAECVDEIREQLLCKVERKHISIECNPTSNIRIGEVKNYEEHPIVRFFNHGLKTPYPSHNVCVSINTDDKGVFVTSLEREYSMMALSLEKGIQGERQNSPREILDWLNHVRKMSQEQMFNKTAIG